jgi:hypothetical protein
MKVDAPYWPRYCEENVWHACDGADGDGLAGALVMVISNDARAVAFWEQRAAPPGEVVFWDYHVVLLTRDESRWRVIDPDCRAGRELAAARWLDASFAPLAAEHADHRPVFRLVPTDVYRRELRSDRSHMRSGDEWQSPPPPWPTIGDGGSNLMRFVDMDDEFLGEVLDLEALRKRLGQT